MEQNPGNPARLSRRELLISIAIPLLCFGGTAIAILLFRGGIIRDPGSFYWGCIGGAVLLSWLALLKPRRDIVSLLAPLYAVIIFLLPLENKPTVLLQLLFGASLTVLVVRLNKLYSAPPVKKHGEDPMEQYLYDYMHRITPLYRGIDRDVAHDIAAAVLSFKFGLYPNAIASAENAISRIQGGGPFATLRRALQIIRDRAASLEKAEVKGYSTETFSSDDDPYLAVALPPDMIENREDLALDNAILLCYSVSYLYSPDDGQVLDEHQNFVLQTLNPYREPLGL